jgi:hypothetical protein
VAFLLAFLLNRVKVGHWAVAFSERQRLKGRLQAG